LYVKAVKDYNLEIMTVYFERMKQEAQLSLVWGRPYWLSLTLKVI